MPAATGLASCLPDESSAGSLPLVSISLFTPLTAAEMAPYMKRLSRGQTVEGEAGAGPRASLQGAQKSSLLVWEELGCCLLSGRGRWREGSWLQAKQELGRPCSGGGRRYWLRGTGGWWHLQERWPWGRDLGLLAPRVVLGGLGVTSAWG